MGARNCAGVSGSRQSSAAFATFGEWVGRKPGRPTTTAAPRNRRGCRVGRASFNPDPQRKEPKE